MTEEERKADDSDGPPPMSNLKIRGPWLRKNKLIRIWSYGRKLGVIKAIKKMRYVQVVGPPT